MISSYHHLLKSKWLENKRNRRIDHLIYILTQRMLPDYYQARHERQQVGLEGGDLEERHRLKILAHAKSISAKCITCLGNTTFGVASQTLPGWVYVIDTWAAICDCPDFPKIQLCKHLAAVQSHIAIPQVTHEGGPSRISAQCAPKMASTASQPGEALQKNHAPISNSGTRSDWLPERVRLSPNANYWHQTIKNMHGWPSPPRCSPPR